MARHAAQVAGTTSEKRKWEAIWKVEYAAQAPHLAYSMELDASSPHDSYYKFHLNYLTLFNLIRIEKDKSARDLFKRAMGVTDATIGDDQNALYDAFTFGVTGEQRRLDDAALHHRQWLEYKQHLDDVSNHVVNSTRCGTDIECVDQMWLDILIPVPGRDNPIVRSKHANTGEKRARYPLPVKDRKGGDFMWQKDPTILDGNESPTWEPPGADFLLPYWMTRYYSEAARPSLSPLPKWYGPYFN
jgi:hypothetical protein